REERPRLARRVERVVQAREEGDDLVARQVHAHASVPEIRGGCEPPREHAEERGARDRAPRARGHDGRSRVPLELGGVSVECRRRSASTSCSGTSTRRPILMHRSLPWLIHVRIVHGVTARRCAMVSILTVFVIGDGAGPRFPLMAVVPFWPTRLAGWSAQVPRLVSEL